MKAGVEMRSSKIDNNVKWEVEKIGQTPTHGFFKIICYFSYLQRSEVVIKIPYYCRYKSFLLFTEIELWEVNRIRQGEPRKTVNEGMEINSNFTNYQRIYFCKTIHSTYQSEIALFFVCDYVSHAFTASVNILFYVRLDFPCRQKPLMMNRILIGLPSG